MTELRIVTHHPQLFERIDDALESLDHAVEGLVEARAYLDDFSTDQLGRLRRILDENRPEPESREPSEPIRIIDPGWLSLRDAGHYLGGFAASTVRTWVAAGLPAKRFGRQIRIRREDLDAFGVDVQGTL